MSTYINLNLSKTQESFQSVCLSILLNSLFELDKIKYKNICIKSFDQDSDWISVMK